MFKFSPIVCFIFSLFAAHILNSIPLLSLSNKAALNLHKYEEMRNTTEKYDTDYLYWIIELNTSV